MASPKLAAGDGSYDFHLRSLSAASRDSAAAADPASDPNLLQSVRMVFDMCKEAKGANDEMVARAFPVMSKLFQRCAAAPTLSTASTGVLLLYQSHGSRRSRSRERGDRRRSHSRHGYRCDDREPSHQRRREDEDDNDHYDGHSVPARRSSARAPGDAGRYDGGRRQDRQRHRSRHDQRGHGGRYHGLATAALPSIILPATPLGCPSAPESRAAASPVQTVCRDWVSSIRQAPASLSAGSSRLASPPPCPLASSPLPSAWVVDGAPAPDATPTMPAVASLGARARVPDVWDEDDAEVVDGDEAWFDADEDAGALAGCVALAPLLSPPREPVGVLVDAPALAARCAGSGIAVVEDLFGRPPVPLLPAPAPPGQGRCGGSPRLPLVGDRRSVRLSAKPWLAAMDKALMVLHSKMGLDADALMPLEQARRVYVNSYKKAMPSSVVQALTTLFRLNMPSITAADEALIAMAGSGGTELAPSSEIGSIA